MSPPSLHVVADTSVERDACLAQLKLLNARPELLSRPEYAHVVLWVQRVAALVRPADPTLSGKQAAVPSRIPAPPTRRTIAFPTTTGPSASPELPPVSGGEGDPATEVEEPAEAAQEQEVSPMAPASSARSERSLMADHSPPSSASRKASPCTPSRLTPPKSVRRVARHARGQSLESDTTATPSSLPSPRHLPREALALPKSVRRAAGQEQRTSITPEPPSPPKSLRKVRRSVARSPLAPPTPTPPPPPAAAAAAIAAAAAPESPALLQSTPPRVLRNTPARQARANSPHPATPRSAPRPKSAMRSALRSAAKGTPGKGTPARGGTPSRHFAPPPASPPSPSPPPPPPPLPSAAATEPRCGGDGGAALELELGSFPATFQHGTGAEQLRMLHAALRDAAAPIGLEAIAVRLRVETSHPEASPSSLSPALTRPASVRPSVGRPPASARPGQLAEYALAGRPQRYFFPLTQARLPPGKFTLARLSLLLEVMESRKVVATEKGSSAPVRWQLRA